MGAIFKFIRARIYIFYRHICIILHKIICFATFAKIVKKLIEESQRMRNVAVERALQTSLEKHVWICLQFYDAICNLDEKKCYKKGSEGMIPNVV